MFPQVFGKYVLERELASGGMAVVYLATLRGAGGFEKRLVVKQIRAELASDEVFVARFVAEAKTTVELSHPNIVPVYELGVEQGVYFIAMELAVGVTLSELLQAGGPVSAEEGAYLGAEICRALDYAHRRAEIVHRDVTPRNVLIDEEGAVRLIDFGIAAPVSVDGAPRERVYGSPGHMPIEQVRGGRLTAATDVFAVAALLIEAWTGMPPFRRPTRTESEAALALLPRPLAEYDTHLSSLDDLIARSVAFDAGERPQTAEELARPLRDFIRAADSGDLARRLGERVRRARSEEVGRLDATPTADGTPREKTPATRRLTQTETFASRDEVVEWTRAPSAPPERVHARKAPARIAVTLVAVLLAVAAVVAFVTRPRAPRRRTPPSSAAPAVPVPAAIAPRASTSRTPTREEPVPAATPAPAVEEEKPEGATFTFTSDLPARVVIDGASQGETPLRAVRRPAGRHLVTLVNAELGEHLSANIDAKPAQNVAVHAEFTRAVPTLHVR